MTDKEIEKALELCTRVSTDCSCLVCPYKKYSCGVQCVGKLTNDVRDYINRLKAENERLSTELSHREQDLIHADENVFYREQRVKLCEDEIKKQVSKETAKEIINDVEGRLKALCKQQGAVEEFHIKYIKNSLMKTYGVEVDE